MRVLGLDPSLKNFGFVVADVDLETLSIDPIVLRLSETDRSKLKSTRRNSDDLFRSRSHSIMLDGLLSGDLTDGKPIQMVFCEVPVGSQSARAMASYGVCIGIISNIRVPVIEVSPDAVKIASVGSKTASKSDMIYWATQTFPNLNWLRQGPRLIAKNEHLADALGAIKAGLQSQDFTNARAILRHAS